MTKHYIAGFLFFNVSNTSELGEESNTLPNGPRCHVVSKHPIHSGESFHLDVNEH